MASWRVRLRSLTLRPATRVYEPDEQPMLGRERIALGWLMVAVPLLLLTQVIAVWPAVQAATAARAQPTTSLLFGLLSAKLSADGALLLLVAFVGALASLAEASFRFSTNAGRGQLSRRWTWAYALRPVQGATLATIVYFALRGGLLSVSNSTNALNPYGVAAVAGLVGLFTRQAFQKLKDVFNMLWNVDDLDANVQPRRGDGTNPSGGNGTAPRAASGNGGKKTNPGKSARRNGSGR